MSPEAFVETRRRYSGSPFACLLFPFLRTLFFIVSKINCAVSAICHRRPSLRLSLTVNVELKTINESVNIGGRPGLFTGMPLFANDPLRDKIPSQIEGEKGQQHGVEVKAFFM